MAVTQEQEEVTCLSKDLDEMRWTVSKVKGEVSQEWGGAPLWKARLVRDPFAALSRISASCPLVLFQFFHVLTGIKTPIIKPSVIQTWLFGVITISIKQAAWRNKLPISINLVEQVSKYCCCEWSVRSGKETAHARWGRAPASES